MRNILINDKLNQKFANHINGLMKCLAKVVFAKDSSALLDFTVKIISDIATRLDELPTDTELSTSRQSTDAYEISIARLTVQIQSLNDELESAKDKEDYLNAARIKLEIEQLKKKREEATANLYTPSIATQRPQSPMHSQQSQSNIADHPEALYRCLRIFSNCLQFGNFKEVNAVMLIHIDNLVMNHC